METKYVMGKNSILNSRSLFWPEELSDVFVYVFRNELVWFLDNPLQF